MSRQIPLTFGEITETSRKAESQSARNKERLDVKEFEKAIAEFEAAWIPEPTPERKAELAKICNDRSLDFESARRPACEEAGRSYMAELEEASRVYAACAFVFWKQWDSECTTVAVVTLRRRSFFMDWCPATGDAQEDKRYWEQEETERKQEIQDKRWAMGWWILFHDFEPLGMFCISADDEEEGEPGNQWLVWRFIRAGGPAEQDFLETVANAFRFAGFVGDGEDLYSIIDFWKRDDGTFVFHFRKR